MGPNEVKKGLTGPNVAKRAKRGQMGSNGADYFACTYFYEIKKSCLATQSIRQKLAELWGFC